MTRSWDNEEFISRAEKLWADHSLTLHEVRCKLSLGESTFRTMRAAYPVRFPKRNKANGYSGNCKPVEIKKVTRPYALKGEGFNLVNGKDWLHLSGETITSDKNYIWRGTRLQAENMMAKSEHNLELTKEVV